MANKVGSSGRGIRSGAGQYGVKLVGSLAGKGAEAKGEKLAPQPPGEGEFFRVFGVQSRQ